ncbi:MAG: 50S ribosomal protein L23 [Endomicrobium sp.]|jgi:large subunit ribosomal protein L23|nr:50S ribosomal protein L23 [Endomicrobium sp.]
MNIKNILKKLIVSEKASIMKKNDNKYTFVVHKNANKFHIKQAIKDSFNVEVSNVRILNYSGKIKRIGIYSGYKSNWKKAIIKLNKGQEIHFN